MQELERPHAVDLVEAVEEFDVGAVAEAERVVHPADFGVFVATHSSGATPSQWPRSTMNGRGASSVRPLDEADEIAAGERLMVQIDFAA